MVCTDHNVNYTNHAVNSTDHGVICRIILDIQMNSSDIFQVFIRKEGSINSVHIHLPHRAYDLFYGYLVQVAVFY